MDCIMKNELISVIMSVYNETIDELKRSIESILKQSYSNIEFIIINDSTGIKFQYYAFRHPFSFCSG